MKRLQRSAGAAVFSCVAVVAGGDGATAANRFVSANGSGSSCAQASPCALATALAQANDNDIVFVGQGTYRGTGPEVVNITKNIRLYGGWDGAPTGGPGRNRTMYVSTIDGQNARRGVTIDGNLTVTVDGFTITNGNANGLTTHCVGSGGAASGCGGGVFVYQAAATISFCTIRENAAATGLGGSPSTTAYGGGIYAWFSNGLDIRRCTITENVATNASPDRTGAGGGVYLVNNRGTSRLRECEISYNVATAGSLVGWGGGIALSHGSTAVESNTIHSNRASTSGGSQGSGIYVWYGAHTIGGNLVIGNRDDQAVYLGFFSGTFASNRVIANPAEEAVHLVYQDGATSPLLVNNVIEGTGSNTIYATSSATYPLTATLDHNTIAGDRETTGVYANTNTTLVMTNNVLAYHGLAVDAAAGGLVQPTRTLFWENLDDGIQGTQPLTGNPDFLDRLGRDFHIRPGSAAADTGLDAGVLVDIDGSDRPLGAAPDIGADEIVPTRFDFGTTTSPVASGYTRAAHTTVYNATKGFGWASGAIGSRDRGVPDSLKRDFCFTPLGTFAVDVPNGPYDVVLTLGDATNPHQEMGLLLEGALVDSVTTPTNTFLTKVYGTTVADGQLSVTFDDLGGADPNVAVNALEVRSAGVRHLDFGTAGSPVAPGWTRASQVSSFNLVAGFGWLSGTIGSRDRASGSDLARDFNLTASGVLGVTLPSGEFLARLLIGDSAAAHDQMRFGFESPLVGFTLANRPAGDPVWSGQYFSVADGRLDLSLTDLGGSDPNVVINALDIAPRDRLLFDFGTTVSPVAPGHTRVTPATTHGSPLSRFGWLTGVVGSRDRGAGSDLNRDFNFSPAATFVADLPDGNYTVTLTIGDMTAKHDQMGLYLEGALVDTVTTSAGQFFTQTYQVDVQDGQLTVALVDLGGSDVNVVINALEIR